MIKFLTTRSTPTKGLLRYLICPDPDLLGSLAEQSASSSGEVRERINADFSRIVSSIRIGDAWKRTGPQRLERANHALARHIKRCRPGASVVLDVGGSDGVTTVELVRHLRRELHTDVRAFLLDLFIRLHRYDSKWLKEYRSALGHPVMVRIGRFGLRLADLDSTPDPTARFLGRFYLSRKRYRGALDLAEEISLINPRVQDEGAIHVIEGDMFDRNESFVDAIDVVRACNVLNLSYFSEERIKRALSHFHSYLRADGLLLVSRNFDPDSGNVERGSVWRRADTGFEPLEDFGGGSDIAYIVNDLQIGPGDR